MRILSQDGKYDFPYERVCIEISDSGKIFAQGDIWGAEDNYIEAARYENEAKARKAMEILREAYSPIMIIQEQDEGIKPNIKPNNWLLTPALPTQRIEIADNFYFQFPADDEVEV